MSTLGPAQNEAALSQFELRLPIVYHPPIMTQMPTTRSFAAAIRSRLVLPANSGKAIAVGALGGTLWGVVARVWMRLISTEHEFTVNGTVGIVVIFAVFGLGQTVAALARRSAGTRRRQILARIFAVVVTLPMGLAAGGQMLPFLLLAAAAIGRVDFHRYMRTAVFALAAVAPLLVLRQLLEDLPLWRAILGWALMLVIYAPLVWSLARALRPIRWSGQVHASE